MTTSSPEKSYFDLHITGLGYLNRVRDVKPKKGDSFLACDIAALNGPSDKPEYRRFDVKVSGSEAQHLIRRCKEAVDAERKVLIGFRLGDLWTDIFTYAKGKNEGKPGVSLKARLLFVSWIKVDGQIVYKAEPKASDDSARDEASIASSESVATSIGEFVIKNAELDQYREGKYDGDFIITEIRPSTYNTSGRMVIEIRAHLGGMTLSAIDRLTRDEASRLSPQEVDPIDEERQAPGPVIASTTPEAELSVPSHPLVDTTPFGTDVPAKTASQAVDETDDVSLFGSLWPLAEIVKLDATVDRRLLRQQRDRLGALGYEFAPLSQDWHLIVTA